MLEIDYLIPFQNGEFQVLNVLYVLDFLGYFLEFIVLLSPFEHLTEVLGVPFYKVFVETQLIFDHEPVAVVVDDRLIVLSQAVHVYIVVIASVFLQKVHQSDSDCRIQFCRVQKSHLELGVGLKERKHMQRKDMVGFCDLWNQDLILELFEEVRNLRGVYSMVL